MYARDCLSRSSSKKLPPSPLAIVAVELEAKRRGSPATEPEMPERVAVCAFSRDSALDCCLCRPLRGGHGLGGRRNESAKIARHNTGYIIGNDVTNHAKGQRSGLK